VLPQIRLDRSIVQILVRTSIVEVGDAAIPPYKCCTFPCIPMIRPAPAMYKDEEFADAVIRNPGGARRCPTYDPEDADSRNGLCGSGADVPTPRPQPSDNAREHGRRQRHADENEALVYGVSQC